MILGTMLSAGVNGPLCFISFKVNAAATTQKILESFKLPSSNKFYVDTDFLFQQELVLVHSTKTTSNWFADYSISVYELPANSHNLKPIENHQGSCQDTKAPNRHAEGYNQRNLGFHNTSLVSQVECFYVKSH